MPRLQIILTSTREGRAGAAIARWFTEKAKQHGGFDVEFVDLKEVGLPLFDEPEHPRKRLYKHAHTRRWSELVGRADAYVFVTPEYNYGMPPALLNALDYLSVEWAYKPAAFVSYGGVSGGLRSVQMAKTMLTSLKMMPLPEQVTVPFFTKMFDAEGTFTPGETLDPSVKSTLDELAKWSKALATLRT